jgi:hypothetical protein
LLINHEMIHLLGGNHVIRLMLGRFLLLLLMGLLTFLLPCSTTYCSDAVGWIADDSIKERPLETTIQAILSN